MFMESVTSSTTVISFVIKARSGIDFFPCLFIVYSLTEIIGFLIPIDCKEG